MCDLVQNNIIKSEYRKSHLLEDKLYEAYTNKDREKIFYFWELLQQEIINSSEHISPEENILIEYGLIKKDIIKQDEIILKYGFIDMIARNAFYNEHKCIWFDQEWVIEKVPANYILYRAINMFYSSYPVISKYIPLISIATRFHLIEAWNYYQILEQLFINEVIDKVHLRQYSAFIKREDKLIGNINKLLES